MVLYTGDISMLTDRQFLYREYVVKNRTAKDIAQEVGRSDTQVRYWLKKHDLPVKPRGGGFNTVDLTGEVFGSLTVTRQIKGNGDCAMWECKCSCGNLHKVKSPYLRRGEIKSCGNCKEHYAWAGCGEMSGSYFASLRCGALKREYKFEITKEYLWSLFLKQDRCCALSGQELFFSRSYQKTKTKEKTEQTASLDRIDNDKGYVQSNVQWVHKMINKMKREYNEDEFLLHVKLIANHLQLRVDK